MQALSFLNFPFFIFTCENPIDSVKHDYTLREVEFDLVNKGYKVETISGCWNGKKENSLIVTNIKDWGLLFRTATALGQEAVIYHRGPGKQAGPTLVDLESGDHLLMKNVVKHETEPQDNFSKLKDGTTFSLVF